RSAPARLRGPGHVARVDPAEGELGRRPGRPGGRRRVGAQPGPRAPRERHSGTKAGAVAGGARVRARRARRRSVAAPVSADRRRTHLSRRGVHGAPRDRAARADRVRRGSRRQHPRRVRRPGRVPAGDHARTSAPGCRRRAIRHRRRAARHRRREARHRLRMRHVRRRVLPAGPVVSGAGGPTAVRGVRLALLVPGGIALLAGLDASLLLLGVGAPVRAQSLTSVHGVLMVLGFVGTVVSLERAVALGRVWGFLAPAALGAGGILLLTPAPRDVGAALPLIGTAALVAVYVPLWRRNTQSAVLVQAAGGVLAVGGTALWLGGVDVPWLLPWLVSFLVLTIAGERLELAHVALTD